MADWTILPIYPPQAGRLLRFLLALDRETVAFFHPHPFDHEHVERLLSGTIDGSVSAFQAVAPGGQELAAYGWLAEMDSEAPWLGLCVGAPWRGKGAGRALTTCLLDEATLRGRARVRLSVVKANARALALYRGLGFEVVEDREAEDPPSWRMARVLAPSAGERAAAIRRRLSGRRIRMVPYTHCDWAWVHTRHWHARRYALVFEEVLALLRRDPGYRWYLDNYACELAPLLEHRPDLLPELRARVAQGAIAICGGYSNVRPHMVGDETFVRSLQIGRRLFGALFPEADLSVHADCVDVAAGHPQLPQVLTLAGYTALRTWRPYGALSLKGVPTELVWEGIDGSRIVMSRGCYGGLWEIADSQSTLRAPEQVDADGLLAALWDAELQERTRMAAGSLVWLARGCDDTRPGRLMDDTPFDERSLVDRWNALGLPEMRFATPVEYFAELAPERAALPVVRGELDACDVAYNAAWNGEQGLAPLRVANDAVLCEAETFLALAAPHGHACPNEVLEARWRDHLLTCAHATQWLYAEDFALIRDRAEQVRLEAARLRDDALDALVRAVGPAPDTLAVAFNALPWDRAALVPLTLSSHGQGWPVSVVDPDGRPLPVQVLEEFRGQGGYAERRALALVDLPALGYAALRERAGEAPPTPAARPRLRPAWDGARLAGLEDRDAGTGWKAVGSADLLTLRLASVAVGEGPLHVGPIVGEELADWSEPAALETGPLRWRWRREGRVGGIGAAMELAAFAHEPRLDCTLEIDWSGHDGFLAARWAVPPDSALWADVPFAVAPRRPEEEPYGMDQVVGRHSMERTRRGLFYARSWVAAERADTGLAFVSRNTDRYYLRDGAAGALEHILINSVMTREEWEARVEPTTLGGLGRHRFAWSLLLYTGGWRGARLPRAAASIRSEPRTRAPARSSAPATLPARASLVRLEPAGLLLSALFEEESAITARISEVHGEAVRAELTLPWEPAGAVVVDLNGRMVPGAEVEARGRAVSVALRPWQIMTLCLRPPAR